MARSTGRERQWPLYITIGSTTYPFPIMNDENGVPVWQVDRVPDLMGQGSDLDYQERGYRSWHGGMGWGQHLVDNVYHLAIDMDMRFPMQGIRGPEVNTLTPSSTDNTVGVTGIFEKGTKIYTISGKWVNEINPSDDSITASGGTFPYDLTTNNAGAVGTVGVNFDGNVVIGVTTASGASMVSFSGSAFDVLSDNSALKGAYLARYWEDTDWRLAITYLASSAPSVAWIAQGADPEGTPTPWSAAYGVGDTSTTLTGIVAHERTLYIAASDGLYVLEGQAGRAPLLIPAMPRDSTNGINTAVSMDGNVWYPTVSGLYLFDPNQGTIDDVTPGRGLPQRSSAALGTVTAIAFFRGWTYLALYNGTHSYIMAGRQREEGEPGFGPYIWHGALTGFASTKVTSMLVSSLVSPPRLWIGLLSGNVAYFRLPSKGDNPLLDSAYRYAITSGTLYMGADDFGVPGMRWNLQDVVLEGYGLSASTNVTVNERRDSNLAGDNSSGYTALQSNITTDGRTVMSPTGDKRFNRVELALAITNNDNTTTPVIRALAAKAARRATKKDLISTTIILSGEAISRLGVRNRYEVNTLATQLDTLDSLNPVTVKHFWLTGAGTEITALVTNIRKRVLQQKGDSAAALAYDLQLKVVS